MFKWLEGRERGGRKGGRKANAFQTTGPPPPACTEGSQTSNVRKSLLEATSPLPGLVTLWQGGGAQMHLRIWFWWLKTHPSWSGLSFPVQLLHPSPSPSPGFSWKGPPIRKNPGLVLHRKCALNHVHHQTKTQLYPRSREQDYVKTEYFFLYLAGTNYHLESFMLSKNDRMSH